MFTFLIPTTLALFQSCPVVRIVPIWVSDESQMDHVWVTNVSEVVLIRTSKMHRLGSLASKLLVSAAKSLSYMDVAISCDLVTVVSHVQLLQLSHVSERGCRGQVARFIAYFIVHSNRASIFFIRALFVFTLFAQPGLIGSSINS